MTQLKFGSVLLLTTLGLGAGFAYPNEVLVLLGVILGISLCGLGVVGFGIGYKVWRRQRHAWRLEDAKEQNAILQNQEMSAKIRGLGLHNQRDESTIEIDRLARIIEKQNEALFYQVNGGVFADKDAMASRVYIPTTQRGGSAESVNDLVEVQPVERHILSAVNEVLHIILLGGTGKGKTTVMRHIEQHMIDRGAQVLVMDSHALPDSWQSRTVGAKRNYANIKLAMEGAINEMQRRSDQQLPAQMYAPLVILVDEFTLMGRNIDNKDFKVGLDFLAKIGTEGRKFGMQLVIGTHSQRVEALGLKGWGDIRDNFTLIKLVRPTKADIPYAQIDMGNGFTDDRYTWEDIPETVYMPKGGEFVQSQPKVIDASPIPAKMMPDDLTEDERALWALLEANPTISYNKLIHTHWGSKNTGRLEVAKKVKTLFEGGARAV